MIHALSQMHALDFPQVPAGWYYACASRDLRRGPIGIDLPGARFVLYRTSSGQIVALDGRCSHLSADLSLGTVAGECIRCPLHEWEYGADGACVRIPASHEIPAFARQASYPTRVVGGHIFFHNCTRPAFEFPFFDRDPLDLLPAPPFEFVLDMPWYLVGANGFDLQHFRAAHDRTLAGEAAVTPSALSRRIVATFDVTGTGIRDQLTRWASGPQVRMTVTSYLGSIILVQAQFQRTTSYGMVCISPIDASRSRARIIIWVPRRGGSPSRWIIDPLDALIRRWFIRAFLRPDAERARGLRYNPATLIDADRELDAYLKWLRDACRGSGQAPALNREVI